MMAIGVVMEFDGATLEQYDKLLEAMGLEREGSAPPGCMFHWVSSSDSGVRVTDVWESREQFDDFGHSRIGPLVAQVGMPGPSQTRYFDVHNYLSADA
jgi:hypothetical protein